MPSLLILPIKEGWQIEDPARGGSWFKVHLEGKVTHSARRDVSSDQLAALTEGLKGHPDKEARRVAQKLH